jgi:hypothetical protein
MLRPFLTYLLLLLGSGSYAQTTQPLFADDKPLSFTLAGQMQVINRDRAKPKEGQKPRSHPAQLSVVEASGDTTYLRVGLLVRGNFRREGSNCRFPPLWLDVPKKAVQRTIFAEQNKLKLVTHCQLDDYVVREYLVYRLYNLLTPLSLQARLAQVTYLDSARKRTETHWGILIEDLDNMARRNQVRMSKVGTRGQHADSLNMATAAVFEYMIGNTDWSVPYRHNIRVMIDSTRLRPLVVPYDFDHAGIVNARYANPAEHLNIETVRDRLYRGPVYPASLLRRVFDKFIAVKPEIYAFYETNPHLDRTYVRDTLHWQKRHLAAQRPVRYRSRG